ncbi:DNA repair protein SWI5 homolog [Sminthopsis crassicaudata]|uniref:DNA repair protein SWI5 homolog n=1 Tax=Sminthopsis crassicaudata TaxID=9301 RepID=UPI003D68EE2B
MDLSPWSRLSLSLPIPSQMPWLSQLGQLPFPTCLHLPRPPGSQVPTPKSGQANETNEESLRLEIQELKQKRDTLDQEISQLMAEGYVVSELEDHISLLHEYNDIKDVGQMLMGKLARIRGVTTKELYPEFDLDMND